MSRGLVGFALTRNPEGFHTSFKKSCSCKQTLVIYSSVVSIFISLIMFLLCEFTEAGWCHVRKIFYLAPAT